MLKISQSDHDTIRRHGEKTYPHECCGVLLGIAEGDVRTVRETVQCGNTRTDSAHNRYNIDPRELVRIQRQARESELDIVGFYHSHPDHPAFWSATDLAEAHWIGCSYVITNVDLGKAVSTNSFALIGQSEEEKQFRVEPVQVIEADGASEAPADSAKAET
jgi:proteasome lid subunit RPN8/RPN11